MAGRAFSPTDAAFAKLKALLDGAALAGFDSPDLSESDTRSKLIDPLFIKVLGWTENDVRREKPVADGYVDYVIGAEFPHLHVEAKRLQPRFQLHAAESTRNLKLSGPHLLANKGIRDHIEQAARYSFELGTDCCVLTNGSQFLLWRTHARGRSWRDGFAYVWHSYEDILRNFAEFYGILSADRVRAGSLHEALDKVDGVTSPNFVPRTYIHNPDRELVRNPYWAKMSRVFGPLLAETPDDEQTRRQIIEHCYVSTPLSDRVDDSIDQLIRDSLPKRLADAGVSDLQPGDRAFEHQIDSDIKLGRPKTYLLTGGVGSGKTTFLRRFALTVQPELIRAYCTWIHIDYLPLGNVAPDDIDRELRIYTYAEIRRIIEAETPDRLPLSGEGLRELFAKQVERAKLTRLHGVDEASGEYQRIINDTVGSLYDDDVAFVEAALARQVKRGWRIVLVLDNSDQLGESFQQSLFLLSQKLSRDLSAVSIVALREEKFFAAYRRGIFDAYGDHRFHLGSPLLSKVVQRRLSYGLKKYESYCEEAGVSDDEREEVVLLVRTFIRSATQQNENIVRLLSCVSNGDMRYALSMFRNFVSSGNTYVGKILQLIRELGAYTVPFHEFAKSAILGNRRFFNAESSDVVNIFVPSSARGASPLTAPRLLARLDAGVSVASPHGEGFIKTSQVLAEFRESFGTAEDVVARSEELLRRGLVESEPPRETDILKTDALKISASGAYYWRYLARSFAYLDLVFVDTPLNELALAKELASMAESTDLEVRFARVRKFLDWLSQVEAQELGATRAATGPYSRSLVVEIRDQIEKEIRVIARKTGASSDPVPDIASS